MSRTFGASSLDRLEGVHPDLVRVVCRALVIAPTDFMVIEGLRTREQQRRNVAAGKSQTMNSRHLYGLAVDLAPIDPATGKVSWDWRLFTPFGAAVKSAAEIEGIAVTWGGDWTTLKDGPHFELPHARYPNGTPCPPCRPLEILDRMRAADPLPVPAPAPDAEAGTPARGGIIALLLAALRAFLRPAKGA